MQMFHEVVHDHGRAVLVVSFAGRIAPGSKGNDDASESREYVLAHLTDQHGALILDLADLDYESGNHVGQWFLPASARARIPVRLVATGRTAERLMAFLAECGLLEVFDGPPLHPSLAAALESLTEGERS